jgi:hypothetical protein
MIITSGFKQEFSLFFGLCRPFFEFARISFFKWILFFREILQIAQIPEKVPKGSKSRKNQKTKKILVLLNSEDITIFYIRNSALFFRIRLNFR